MSKIEIILKLLFVILIVVNCWDFFMCILGFVNATDGINTQIYLDNMISYKFYKYFNL